MNIQLTSESLNLFQAIVNDLPNWSGCTPCFNHITKEGRGNLTDLKRKGLVTTFRSDGEEWIQLTEQGEQYSASIEESKNELL